VQPLAVDNLLHPTAFVLQYSYMREFIKEKRTELIWALGDQGYSQAHLAEMFNTSRVDIMRVMKRKPKEWNPKWVKQQG